MSEPRQILPQGIAFRFSNRGFIPRVRRGGAALQGHQPRADRILHLAQHVRAQRAFDLDTVHLLQMPGNFQQPVDQIPVVGQQEESFGVEVQPSGGENALRHALKKIAHALAAFRVVHRGHATRRLVENEIKPRLRKAQQLAAHLDVVGVRIGLAAKLGDHMTVDRHLPRQNELLGMPPRSDARAGNQFLQTLLHLVPFSNSILHAKRLRRLFALRVLASRSFFFRR